MKVIQGNLISREYRFALVVSRFNEIVSQKLVDGAIDFLLRHNVKEEDIDIIWVPGAFEIPQVAKVAVQRRDIDAVICLGAVIRGSTVLFCTSFSCVHAPNSVAAAAIMKNLMFIVIILFF